MESKKPAKKKSVPFDEKRFFTWLRSALRSASRRYPPIYEALAAAKRPYTGNNPRQKVCYECAACGTLASTKEVAVDHRVDCGKLTSWDDVQGFMERLFCGKEGLDVLCHECHDRKTYMTKHNVSMEEATLMKAVLLLLKGSKKDILALALKNGYNEQDVSNDTKRREVVYNILKEHTK